MRIAALLLAAIPMLCAAQAEAPVPRPQVNAGDRWVYNRMDYWQNKVTGKRDIQVALATERVIQVVGNDGGREYDETFTPDWNAVATNIGNYDPDSALLKFPMQPGTSYPVTHQMVFGPSRNMRVRREQTARVVGWEELSVPAGKFRALKVVVEGSFQRLDTSVSGTNRFTVWYAPEVKRWVKLMYEDAIISGGPRGPFNKFGEELVEFKLQ